MGYHVEKGERESASSAPMSHTTSLVTGGCGFIGRHLVELLVQRGHRVRVLDNACGPQERVDAELIRGSVLDEDLLASAVAGADFVFHLAANPQLWAPDKAEFERVNHLGTQRVLAAAERAAVKRIVYTSTESILKGRRTFGAGVRIDETASARLEEMPGPYCRSKLLAEHEALAAAARGVPVVIVNPTLPIGPGDHKLTPPSRMLLMFLNGEARAYLDCELNLIDVRDAALGHLLAAERGRVGERYILGHENVRLCEVLQTLEELTGLRMPRIKVSYLVALATAYVAEFVADHVTRRPPIAPVTGVRLAGSPSSFTSRKAVEELGLPQTPLRLSLAHAIAWFAQRGMLRRTPSVRVASLRGEVA